MPHDQRTQLILDTFLKAVTRRSDKEQRIQNGLYLRQQLQNALRQGVVPVHPRFEWVRKQARAVLELLLTLAKDYDAANPTASDTLSMADLLDICDMTRGHIGGIISAGVMDPTACELLPYEEVVPEVAVTDDPAQAIKDGEPEDSTDEEDDGDNEDD